jgi:hypothetical protein
MGPIATEPSLTYSYSHFPIESGYLTRHWPVTTENNLGHGLVSLGLDILQAAMGMRKGYKDMEYASRI